jgi:1-deoxy-D-xylulose-5-phosphate synthase
MTGDEKMLLESIKKPQDIKTMSDDALLRLSVELRQVIINTVNINGGHLSSNLGVIELSIALHKTFNSPEDKIIWDVGHQGYPHKLLTGRLDQFHTLRELNGMSGFLKREESPHDAFNAGHSSTSISAALGVARSNKLLGNKNHAVAVIGDGSLTGGMAFEALNYAGHSQDKIIVVLNDNGMSIAPNVGSISKCLAGLRTNAKYYKLKNDTRSLLNNLPEFGEKISESIHKVKDSVKNVLIPGMFFENMGFTYLGPVDGHDIEALSLQMDYAKKVKGPVILHVLTQKGKGYMPAEKAPEKYHGVGKLAPKKEIDTDDKRVSYSKIFGDTMIELAQKNSKVTCFTAAMPAGTGLTEFAKVFPDRFIDVGIAEQNAVTMAGGMASMGLHPVVAVYSTFLQRAYDQILHDVALQDLPVTFAIDRAGLVGHDGETHHGIYDLSYLLHMPNMHVYAPKNGDELQAMLAYTSIECDHPAAIRYPRGKSCCHSPFTGDVNQPEIIYKGNDGVVIAAGSMVETTKKAVEALIEEGIRLTFINPRRLKPLDMLEYAPYIEGQTQIVTIEENVEIGGFGTYFGLQIAKRWPEIQTKVIGVGDEIIHHGSQEELLKEANLDVDALIMQLKSAFRGE